MSNNISMHNANSIPYSDADSPVLFNSFFTFVFTKEDNSNISYVPDFDYRYMAPVDVIHNGIVHLIKDLKVSSYCSVDEI